MTSSQPDEKQGSGGLSILTVIALCTFTASLSTRSLDPVLPNNNLNGWFNSGAFSNPVAATFGNCGRNTMRGPWLGNQDVSVIKLFPIAERKNLEFRMEMFNAPNHVELTASGQLSWNNGSSPAPASSFGKLTAISTAMRQIQFALKFNF